MAVNKVYKHCAKCRMKYDYEKVILVAVNFTLKLDHLS